MLAGCSCHLLCPEGFDASEYQALIPDAAIVRVPKEQMSSWFAYSAALCSEGFYRAFSSYQYVLNLDLDGLILNVATFSSWLHAGFDYVGAPFFSRGPRGLTGGAPVPKRAGIGGVSLRKVDSFRRILAGDRKRRRLERPPGIATLYRNPKWKLSNWIQQPHSWERVFSLASAGLLPEEQSLPQLSFIPEDQFWAFHVPRWFSDWRMPGPRQSLRFAFDLFPQLSYEITGVSPFAVHGRPNIEAIRSVLDGTPPPTSLDEYARGDPTLWKRMIQDTPLNPTGSSDRT